MTLIIINKTSQGYSATIQDRVAVINNEEPKAGKKVLANYLNKLSQQKGATI